MLVRTLWCCTIPHTICRIEDLPERLNVGEKTRHVSSSLGRASARRKRCAPSRPGWLWCSRGQHEPNARRNPFGAVLVGARRRLRDERIVEPSERRSGLVERVRLGRRRLRWRRLERRNVEWRNVERRLSERRLSERWLGGRHDTRE